MTHFSKALSCICLFSGALLFGADDGDAPAPPPKPRRTLIGIRAVYFPTNLFKTQDAQSSASKPIADYAYSGYFGSTKEMLAPTVEYRLSDHFSLTGEIDWRRLHFQQVTDMRSGKRDPNSSYDDRVVSTINATTTANYWEMPIMARYYYLRGNRWLARTYANGGVRFRHVAGVATTTDSAWADGVTEHSTTPLKPNLGNQFGAVVGVGFRYIDETGVQFFPEVRFTRWKGAAFQGPAYRSVANEIEVGIGISF